MDNRTRKVSSAMEPYIKFVLERDGIPYQMEKRPDFWLFQMDMRNKYISRIPVYSFRTLMNRDKLERLMALNQRRGYHILKQDEAKYFAAVDR